MTTSPYCSCTRRLAGLQCSCVHLAHPPSPDCGCSPCRETTVRYWKHFHRPGRPHDTNCDCLACFQAANHFPGPSCECPPCRETAKHFQEHFHRLRQPRCSNPWDNQNCDCMTCFRDRGKSLAITITQRIEPSVPDSRRRH